MAKHHEAVAWMMLRRFGLEEGNQHHQRREVDFEIGYVDLTISDGRGGESGQILLLQIYEHHSQV
jgi:hypothetical protein